MLFQHRSHSTCLLLHQYAGPCINGHPNSSRDINNFNFHFSLSSVFEYLSPLFKCVVQVIHGGCSSSGRLRSREKNIRTGIQRDYPRPSGRVITVTIGSSVVHQRDVFSYSESLKDSLTRHRSVTKVVLLLVVVTLILATFYRMWQPHVGLFTCQSARLELEDPSTRTQRKGRSCFYFHVIVVCVSQSWQLFLGCLPASVSTDLPCHLWSSGFANSEKWFSYWTVWITCMSQPKAHQRWWTVVALTESCERMDHGHISEQRCTTNLCASQVMHNGNPSTHGFSEFAASIHFPFVRSSVQHFLRSRYC
jgi:hypothetical protein